MNQVAVTPASRVRVSPHVVSRPLPNETILLDLDTGRYFGLSTSGGRMLDALTRTDRVEQVVAECAEYFAQPLPVIEADVCELFELLLRKRILVATDR